MSVLPKQLPVDRSGLERIKSVPETKTWLARFMRRFDEWFLQLHDWTDNITFANGVELLDDGNVAGEDGNWRIIVVSGDLKFQKRVSNEWIDGPTILGS